MRARLVSTVLILPLALGMLIPTAHATAPNDDCSTPTAISGNGPFPFDLTMATTGTQGQTNPACNQQGLNGITNDLWYCWTPSCSGLALVETCGQTTVDTKIAFYHLGCGCPTVDALCCDDDSCGLQSSFTCEVTCGVPVLIQIGTKPGAPPGTGTFSIQCLGTPCDCDQCCGTRPNFLGGASFSTDVASMTLQAWSGGPVLKYFDIGAPQPATGSMVNWYAPVYAPSGPQDWSQPNLGTVFGITLDALGNTYITHASLYNGDVIGTIAGGAAGAIYKIDTNTGVPSTFAVLPNNFITGCTYTTDCHPALGNICYSCAHDNLYVSNHEDGRIYRLNTSGTILSTWKHSTGTAAAWSGPDPFDTNGFSPLTPHPTTQRGQRVWAVRVSNGRLYYSVWREDGGRPDPARANEIWSVALLPGGDFLAGSEFLELSVPAWNSSNGGNYSEPVSDISFKPGTCCMLLAERSMSDDTFSGAHDARVLEYCKVNGGPWVPSGNTFDVGASLLDSSAGGIDYDFHTGAGVNVNVWVTGDAIKLGEPPATDPYIYGLGGMTFGGTNPYANGLMIDSNQLTSQGDKTQQGDVEISCPTGPPPTCQVSPDRTHCVNACQLPGYFCVPVEIKVFPGGLWEVTRCDCLPDGHCHIEFDALVGPICVGVCPNGEACNLDIVPNADGSTTYSCNCDPVPPVCEPSPTGTACTNACTPVPGMQCVPVEITVDMNGNWTVTDCDCLPDGQCHVDFVPGVGITCVQNCLGSPLPCQLRVRGNLDGSFTYRCYCDDVTTNCGPISVCDISQPGTCKPACAGDCPPGFVCVPTEIREYPLGSGNFTITECTCVPIDHPPCRPIVMNGLVQCKGTCPSGNTCRLTRTLEPLVPPIEHQGARYRCECNCARPPLTMSAWWPMADATGAVVRDIAGVANNGTPLPVGSTPTSVAGCVGSALSFDGVNDWVRVPDQAEIDFGLQPFTIDAWVKTTVNTGLNVILDKRDPATIRGYTVFLGTGQLALQMGDGGGNFANFVHPTNIGDGNCHHIAVVVRRGIGSTVELWVDGGPPTILNNNTIVGSLDNAVDLFIGKRQPIPSEIFFNGVIDEVEFFKRALTATEIQSLYGAGPAGKCRESAYPPNVVFCNGESVKSMCFTICNYATTAQNYNWNLFGPVGGAGCQYLGPITFTPSSGNTNVPAGQCVTVCVNVSRPGGLAAPPPSLTTCYQLNVQNTGTGNTFGGTGQITAIKKWCGIIDTGGGTGGSGTGWTGRVGTTRTIQFEAANEDDQDGMLPYTVRVVVPDGDQPDPGYISLNGLPPGEPVIGTLTAQPGHTGIDSISFEILQHEPFNLLEVVIEGDTDDDGLPELLDRYPIRTVIPCSGEMIGDIDGNGTLDPDDNFRFVQALLAMPIDPYDAELSDVNCDGEADADDIQPFVTAYINGP